MESYFKGFTVEYIERNKHVEDDDLAKDGGKHHLSLRGSSIDHR
jgi:hypothetical protein